MNKISCPLAEFDALATRIAQDRDAAEAKARDLRNIDACAERTKERDEYQRLWHREAEKVKAFELEKAHGHSVKRSWSTRP